jgi:hypothetical protein
VGAHGRRQAHQKKSARIEESDQFFCAGVKSFTAAATDRGDLAATLIERGSSRTKEKTG